MLRGRPGGFRFNVYPVARMFETHSRIVFRSGTGARRPSLKCLRNALCVAITDSGKTFRQRNHAARPSNPWHHLKMARSQLINELPSLYPLHSPSSDASKSGSYFCRTLYINCALPHSFSWKLYSLLTYHIPIGIRHHLPPSFSSPKYCTHFLCLCVLSTNCTTGWQLA